MVHFTMNEYFIRRDGGAVGSFSVEGSITIQGKYTFEKSAIEYSSDLGDRVMMNSYPQEEPISGGFKKEFRSGHTVPLLITHRTKK